MGVHSAAVAQQGSGLGLQQGQAAQVVHHLKGLPGSPHCTSRLLLPQEADRLAHEGVNEALSVRCVQAA